MRLNLFTCGMAGGMLMILACGCAGRFGGEWLEAGSLAPPSELRPVTPGQRMALEFTGHGVVREGTYSDLAGAVDQDSIQSAQYIIFKDGQVAQFGSVLARIENGELLTFVQGQPERRYVRVRGKSVFPPIVTPPDLSRNDSPKTPFAPAAMPTASEPAVALNKSMR